MAFLNNSLESMQLCFVLETALNIYFFMRTLPTGRYPQLRIIII